MKCYVCDGSGTIEMGVGYNTNPDAMIWSDRRCYRCYGDGYLPP